MQIYYEQDYDLLTPETFKFELELYYNNLNVRLIYKYIIGKYIKELFNESYYNITIAEFTNSECLFNVLDKIQDIYMKIYDKNKKIMANLIIKKFLREYIQERLYRYPDGLMLNSLKDNFYKTQQKKNFIK